MKRVLVCDDSTFTQKMIKRELESSFEVVIFSDGKEAYEYLKKDPNFDFAIIDGEMPEMNGWELIKKIKGELGLIDLPVVMLTASDGDYFKNQAFDLGAFDYLKKPFKQGELYDYIKMFFKSDGFSAGRVLVVEDSKLQNKTISHQLKEKNILPISAYSGEEALRLLLEGANVDTILLDINLPGASGFEVAKALKEDSRFNWIPIIGITATKDEEGIEIMKNAFDSGVDDFLTKPYSIVEFYARIKANIHRAKLIEQLKEEAELDFLTKLYNRRLMFRFLQHHAQLSKRNGEALSFLMIDIDKFKTVNDTYGHQSGDEVLKEMANIIKENIRKSDIACRFGGEEFSVLLINISPQDACSVAEKIRNATEKTAISINGQDIHITISIGVSSLTDKDDINSFIKKADDALYKAKEAGRNRIFLNDGLSVSAC
ncbi:diguanylate cyclase [Hippea maritima]|uniref:diguanylate cyclase n=1 Tax=Hippea maritima (strain ATCC 700847 / DSM 10411 / MH2) TaxID=760142 RepID=F2LTI5_HIPMA|nr:diguanylate cyclase [Hippea maritima]AEA33310.1 response regulator receiver modulated diguanylate cyclase [Hippea maritima DSM 10411]